MWEWKNEMATNYEQRIQELESKYGKTFDFLKESVKSPDEIVEYAYKLRSKFIRTWGRYFLFGALAFILVVFFLYKDFVPDIMTLLIALPIILMFQGASYLISIRRVFNDLLKFAAEIEINLI